MRGMIDVVDISQAIVMSLQTDRQRRLRMRNSYLAVSVTLGAVALLVAGWLSLLVIGMGVDDSLNLWQFLWMFAAMIVGLIIGMGLGGWLWVLGARLTIGLTRVEAERLFFHNQPVIPGLDQYNRWCMKLVYFNNDGNHE